VPLDVRELAAEVAGDFRQRAPDRPLAVKVGAAEVVRSVDRTLLRRALMNLLDNAHQYSPAGSEISLEVEPGGDIVVSDRGHGIDPQDLPHLFEPFFRADRSRTRTTGGVGLGLTFVQRVAGLHGGKVDVQSRPGEGSRFRLTLG
jgi:signal transduction histidine kinase